MKGFLRRQKDRKKEVGGCCGEVEREGGATGIGLVKAKQFPKPAHGYTSAWDELFIVTLPTSSPSLINRKRYL